jgi:hypothetical protein
MKTTAASLKSINAIWDSLILASGMSLLCQLCASRSLAFPARNQRRAPLQDGLINTTSTKERESGNLSNNKQALLHAHYLAGITRREGDLLYLLANQNVSLRLSPSDLAAMLRAMLQGH